MVGSDKKISSLNSLKPPASPKPSVTDENNENDLSLEQMIPKSQNSKKPVTKHFMSPTVSAVSKASAPRKKILSERIENSSSSDGKLEKTPTFEAKKSNRNVSVSHSNRSTSPALSWCNHVSESCDDGDTNFAVDSLLKPYDPLVNYLSPRPKYLRFNPNRRREIFLCQKEEVRDNGSHHSQIDSSEEESCTEDAKNSPDSPRKEFDVRQGNEEDSGKGGDNFDDYYEEEFDVERWWCFRGVLKFLFILIAYFLSTSYICSMNSPSPSTAQQAVQGLKDGYLMIRKQTLQAITIKLHEARFLADSDGDSYGEVDKVDFVKDDNLEIRERVEAKMPELDNIVDTVEAIMIEDEEVNLEDHYQEFNGNGNVDDEDSVGEIFGEVSLPEVAKNEDSVHCEVKSKAESFKPKTGESENAGDAVLEEVVESTYQLHELEVLAKSDFGQEGDSPQNSPAVDNAKLQEAPNGSHKKSLVEEAEEIGYGCEVETATTKLNTSAVIGVSVLSIILASMVSFYHSIKARSTCAKESRLMLKPHKPAAEEKVTTRMLGLGKKNESSGKLALTRWMEKAPEELNHYTRTQTVELIGERVVGELSSSLVSFYMKSQKSESEERNATFSPNLDSLSQSVPPPTQPSALEFSTINLPSYRSFTTEKKMPKEEGGKDVEVGVTTVRRSSRLCNRTALASP